MKQTVSKRDVDSVISPYNTCFGICIFVVFLWRQKLPYMDERVES